MKGEHEIGDSFACDHCKFQSSERSLMSKHIEEEHKIKYETCGGNCSDRMYEENTFNCESTLCKICSQSDNLELCWGCVNLLSD